MQPGPAPRIGAVPGLTARGCYLPAGSDAGPHWVGGDWYDLLPLPGSGAGLVIGDVAGHGSAQAGVMSELRGAARALALDRGDRPVQLIRALNRFVLHYLPDELATACYLRYDPGADAIGYAAAGHLPPLFIPAHGPARLLAPAGLPPLGVPWTGPCACRRITARPGDTLVLYTDGLVERRRESLDDGLDRLLAVAAATTATSMDALCTHLLDVQPIRLRTDDIAMLAVRITRPAVQ